jgi:hypothetical protein
MENNYYTHIAQLQHSHQTQGSGTQCVSAEVVECECNNHSSRYIKMENVKFTTPTQQSHNNPSHEGGPHTLGPTLM